MEVSKAQATERDWVAVDLQENKEDFCGSQTETEGVSADTQRSPLLPKAPLAFRRYEVVYECEGLLGLQMFRKAGDYDVTRNIFTLTALEMLA